MKNTIAPALVLLMTLGCAAPIKQFYPGAYFPEDRIYQNKTIGFSFAYRGNWELATDPNEMRDHKSYIKELHTLGAELLFMGNTVEKTQGTRGIVFNLNKSNKEYAEYIRKINSQDQQLDSGLTDCEIANVPMVKWLYEKDGFRFVEFFIKVDTYNVRIAFWTTPDLFPNFLPVYEEIMGTFSITGRN
jgi:hypothetical protein